MTAPIEAQKPVCHINLATEYRGSERQTELLIRGIARWGMRQRLVTLEDAQLAENLEQLEGLEVITVANRPGKIAKAARGSRFVHAHGARSIAVAHRAHFRYRLPYLATVRDERQPARGWLTRRGYRKARVLVALSNAIRKMLANYVPGAKTVVINSCASVHKEFPAAAATLQSRFSGKMVVGHIATLDDARKGQLDLIEVARQMQASHPDIVFLFIGSGPDEELLRAAAADLDNVEFTGQVPNIGDYLRLMSILAFPSRHEGLGSTLLDAMDYAVPIVATTAGGIPELVQDGVNGLLVSPGNIDQLAFAIHRLAGDGSFRQRLGLNGHSKVQAYTPDNMVEQYLNIYQAEMGN